MNDFSWQKRQLQTFNTFTCLITRQVNLRGHMMIFPQPNVHNLFTPKNNITVLQWIMNVCILQPPVQVYGVEGRYAHALYSAATKDKKLDAVEKELNSFNVSTSWTWQMSKHPSAGHKRQLIRIWGSAWSGWGNDHCSYIQSLALSRLDYFQAVAWWLLLIVVLSKFTQFILYI